MTSALAAVLAAHLGKLEGRGTVQVVFIVLFVAAGLRVIASWLCKPRDDPPFRGTIGVVVPFYNEDPDYLRLCLDSLMGQSRSADVIYLIDDGSDSVEASRVASAFPVNVIIQERRGQATRSASRFRRRHSGRLGNSRLRHGSRTDGAG